MSEHISIIGAGLMGHGIAQVFALAGHIVRVYDPDFQAMASLRERIVKNLSDLDRMSARHPASSRPKIWDSV